MCQLHSAHNVPVSVEMKQIISEVQDNTENQDGESNTLPLKMKYIKEGYTGKMEHKKLW